MRLKYITSNDSTVEIELIDNEFVNNWIDYLKATTTRCPDLNWSFTHHPVSATHDTGEHEDTLTALRDIFKFLHTNLNYDLSKDIADAESFIKRGHEIEQSYLNTWHRHFTTIASAYYRNGLTDFNIPDRSKIQEIYDNFHAINQHVHHLEHITYSKLSRRNSMVAKSQYGAVCTDATSPESLADGQEKLWSGSGNIIMIKDSFDFLTEEYHYDAWLNEDIQGKDHIKAWLDHDDLTQEDIWGNSFLTPNVMLDPQLCYSTTLDNEEFRKEYMASNKTLNRWPLGSIVYPENVNWDEIAFTPITTILLDNKIIWKRK